MRFNDIILERDDLQIVTTIKAEENNWSKFEHIDVIRVGLCQLRSWGVEHVKRSVNSAAHIIA
jgi:hypothetical protein